MNPQIDDSGAVEAARQRRQEEIRARLAAGGSTAAALAAVAEDASVTVQQQTADYYTAEEMAKVGSGVPVFACLLGHVACLPARPACLAACITCCRVFCARVSAYQPVSRLAARRPPSCLQFQKPKKKKERKLKKKSALTEDELAALAADAEARGGCGLACVA
jgi:hypothetical protein